MQTSIGQNSASRKGDLTLRKNSNPTGKFRDILPIVRRRILPVTFFTTRALTFFVMAFDTLLFL